MGLKKQFKTEDCEDFFFFIETKLYSDFDHMQIKCVFLKYFRIVISMCEGILR